MEAQIEMEKRKRAQMAIEEEQRQANEARLMEVRRLEAARRREEDRRREEEEDRANLEMLKAKRTAELDVRIASIDILFVCVYVSLLWYSLNPSLYCLNIPVRCPL